MIRINLLGGERQVKKKAISFDISQRLTLACSLTKVRQVFFPICSSYSDSVFHELDGLDSDAHAAAYVRGHDARDDICRDLLRCEPIGIGERDFDGVTIGRGDVGR